MVLQWQSLATLCNGGPEATRKQRDAWGCGIGFGCAAAEPRAAWPPADAVVVPTREGDLSPITAPDLKGSLDEVCNGVRPWDPLSFAYQGRLQDALGNFGTVDKMRSREHGGRSVAVKRMPNVWVTFGHEHFRERHPRSPEQPWLDIGLTRRLNIMGFPYACELLGIFCDDTNTYVATSLATEGDLFAWCARGPVPGTEREELMLPIVAQLLTAARWLHELGVAHRDISVENILLAAVGEAEMRVQLIDFGMAATSRSCPGGELRGKEPYQAPEMHDETAGPYDAFLADAFQLGVVLFIMAAQDLPWASTRQGACESFARLASLGFWQLAEGHRLQRCSGRPLGELLTPGLTELLGGLLEVEPRRRLALGESCLEAEGRRAVWDTQWLEAADAARRPWPRPSAQRPAPGQPGGDYGGALL